MHSFIQHKYTWILTSWIALGAGVTVLDKIHMVSVPTKPVVIRKHDECYDKEEILIHLLHNICWTSTIPEAVLGFWDRVGEQDKQNASPQGLYVSVKKFSVLQDIMVNWGKLPRRTDFQIEAWKVNKS